ncbi:MAG: large subunit ribosomal protein [Solirubrobacteraceae bacterium]|jgi:large subunit ribosomal protein L25|nr:large subunit ribosomal protein [Solirubrobacteraceae bacterium]
MASSDTATLELTTRSEHRSRAVRRLRRDGKVPGVIYGGDDTPVSFEVDARILRNTLAAAGAVLEVTLDGSGPSQPVVVKDLQRHPVRGEIMHADLLRIDMKVAIHTTVTLELTGAEESPGIDEGGVLSQENREILIEALPGDIPDLLTHDVSSMQINDTLLLGSLTAPPGVTFLDDPETVIASITPPTLEPVDEDIETETGLVGEDGEPVADAEEGGDEPAAEAGESAPEE